MPSPADNAPLIPNPELAFVPASLELAREQAVLRRVPRRRGARAGNHWSCALPSPVPASWSPGRGRTVATEPPSRDNLAPPPQPEIGMPTTVPPGWTGRRLGFVPAGLAAPAGVGGRPAQGLEERQADPAAGHQAAPRHRKGGDCESMKRRRPG